MEDMIVRWLFQRHKADHTSVKSTYHPCCVDYICGKMNLSKADGLVMCGFNRWIVAALNEWDRRGEIWLSFAFSPPQTITGISIANKLHLRFGERPRHKRMRQRRFPHCSKPQNGNLAVDQSWLFALHWHFVDASCWLHTLPGKIATSIYSRSIRCSRGCQNVKGQGQMNQ